MPQGGPDRIRFLLLCFLPGEELTLCPYIQISCGQFPGLPEDSACNQGRRCRAPRGRIDGRCGRPWERTVYL